MSDIMKNSWKNLIFIIVLFAVFGVFWMLRGSEPVSTFDVEDGRFVLHGPDDFTVTLELSDISSIETVSEFTPGDCIDGGSEGSYSYGIWENTEFGQYRLCILNNVSLWVVMTEKDGHITVLNFENDQTTEEFGRSFSEYLRQNGYLLSP